MLTQMSAHLSSMDKEWLDNLEALKGHGPFTCVFLLTPQLSFAFLSLTNGSCPQGLGYLTLP